MSSELVLPQDVASGLEQLKAHYEIVEVNNRGQNGFLFRGRNLISKKEVAIKFYAGSSADRPHAEPELLAQINSPNVLAILDARAVSDSWAYFVTPFHSGGDLDDLLSTQPGALDAIDIALGICAGASAIHSKGMLHRDLKPANIVVQNGVPKIADFGSVRMLPSGAAGVVASGHSILYRPPESFGANTYGKQGDIYQIGLVLYQLLGGNLPYLPDAYLNREERARYAAMEDQADRSLLVDAAIEQRATKGRLLDYGTLPPWVSPTARTAIRCLTSANPQERFASVSEVVAALTRCRGTMQNWRRTRDGALLEGKTAGIEIRIGADERDCEAFKVTGVGRRRMFGKSKRSLTELVRMLGG